MALRRLTDIPQIRSLEDKAILEPNLRSRRAGFYEPFEEASLEVFGILFEDCHPPNSATDDEWEHFALRYGYGVETDADVITFFRDRGWDVTDGKGHPIYVLHAFSRQLCAAIYGDFGAKLPDGSAEAAEADRWADRLQKQASQFRGSRPKR